MLFLPSRKNYYCQLKQPCAEYLQVILCGDWDRMVMHVNLTIAELLVLGKSIFGDFFCLADFNKSRFIKNDY